MKPVVENRQYKGHESLPPGRHISLSKYWWPMGLLDFWGVRAGRGSHHAGDSYTQLGKHATFLAPF